MTSAAITIGAELTLCNLPRAVEDSIVAQHTFDNPEYARKQRMGFWMGDVKPQLTLYRRTSVGLVVPRGAFAIVIDTCRGADVPFTVEDATIAPRIDVGLRCGELYPYQRRGLDQLLRWNTGMLQAPTGSGKTIVLLSAIHRLQTPTLILTHTNELFLQMRRACQHWLGVEPASIGANKWSVGPITVATIQTLAKRGVGAIANEFGCVLVDECHHAPAKTWAALLNQFPARYRYGFTATAWRKDGLESLMFRTIGKITARIETADVVSAGKIVPPEIQTVPTAFRYDLEDSSDWMQMISALVQDRPRNQLIAREVHERLMPHTRALLLSDRIDHVNVLAGLLADCNPVVLTGDLTKGARDSAMAAVRAGAPLTIATSSLLGEGVDVPGWDVLFLATPMAGGPRTLQAVGRVSRAAPGKDRATVVDFVDGDVPALSAAHEQRNRLYAQVGRAR